MNFQKPKNSNYAASVVELSSFVELAGCDNIKCAMIYGNSVVVSKGVNEGDLGLFFPVETQLDHEFLANNNLYRKPELGNVDQDKKGFFEQNGRVRAVKLRGYKSEGFWIPLESLSYLQIPLSEFVLGTEFDCIGDHTICRKYIPFQRERGGSTSSNKSGGANKKPSLASQIVENQFRFHPDTENLRRNVHKISPEMHISISDKWHGTSAVFSHLLVNRKLAWYERIAKFLGIKIQEQEYAFVWSSRKVVKGIVRDSGVETNEKQQHYYSCDIWGVVADEIKDRVPKGITLYGEIVGYTPAGGFIQNGYHYGCKSGQHKFVVYRVTYTNQDGKTLEFSWQQMKEFCLKYGFEMVKELWCGRAVDFVSDADVSCHWHEQFLSAIEAKFVTDQMCPYNAFEVPQEGIVLKVDTLSENVAFKLKNFRFLQHETKALDSGEVDMETFESEQVEA